jgi:hypothetical protein
LSDSLIFWKSKKATYCFSITTRKSINTNKNIEGIFPLVNCRRISPMKIFPWYIPRELQWGNKFKTKQKKRWRVIYTNKINSVGKPWTLFIMSITKGITNRKFRRYFPESSGTVHFLIELLITVPYRQNYRWIEKSSVLFDDFLKIFN